MLFDEPIHVGRPNVGNRADFDALVDRIFESRWLSNSGPLVVELEDRIEDFLGVRNCIAMCNGTVALEIAMRALGLTGEVIVPSYTFIATAHALHWQGLTPVFADIAKETHNLDPDSVRQAITPATSGIVGVHLWGRAAPVDELQQIASEHGLRLMFDASHAFGNRHDGRMIGSFGEAEVFSFHATKFFNTFEGGAVVTNNDELAESIRLMRNFGFVDFDEVVYPGTNGKMPEVSAAMGLVNLDSIGDVVERNRENHDAYGDVFATETLVDLLVFDQRSGSNCQYVVVELAAGAGEYRDRLVADLHAENVRARRYFWPGCHRMEPYRTLFPESGERLPNTVDVAERVVVLPTGTAVTPDDCRLIGEFVVSRLRDYCVEGASAGSRVVDRGAK